MPPVACPPAVGRSSLRRGAACPGAYGPDPDDDHQEAETDGKADARNADARRAGERAVAELRHRPEAPGARTRTTWSTCSASSRHSYKTRKGYWKGGTVGVFGYGGGVIPRFTELKDENGKPMFPDAAEFHTLRVHAAGRACTTTPTCCARCATSGRSTARA
ncbi:MAG: hypothetical protein MZV65_33010 [Chromatiales bacterium]|nr:hypothetical protein [Chromatiales bacterium]